jgi:Putative restriction endonuclease
MTDQPGSGVVLVVHAGDRDALAAGADAEVLEAVNVVLPGGKLLVPDVVVAAAGAVSETTTRIPCEAVLAVVEVVFPSTTAIDRAVKPVMYAEAGIPSPGGWSCRARRRSSPAP